MRKTVQMLPIILFMIIGCSSPEKNHIKEQIVQADDNYIATMNEIISAVKLSLRSRVCNLSSDEYDKQFDRGLGQIDTLKQIGDNLRILLGSSLLQGLYWLNYERINKKIINFQWNEHRSNIFKKFHTKEEAYDFILDSKYGNAMKNMLEERRKCLSHLKIISTLEYKDY